MSETNGAQRLFAGRISAIRTALALLTLLALPWFLPQPAAGQSAQKASQQSTVVPLPASDYLVRSVCTAQAPEGARCLALELVPKTAAARARTHPLGMVRSAPITAGKAAAGAFGLRPQDLHSAYQLPTTTPSAPTIALVDAYNDPTAEGDLKIYDEEFGLPACTTASGCFTKLNQRGQASPLPSTDDGWALETSLDIEVAHATCQNCHILVVEAESSSDEDLEVAEDSAVAAGATEVSNSWAGEEPLADSSAFNHPGHVITAASGDGGYLNWDAEEGERGLVSYPASSPHVVAVGGTRLSPLASNGSWTGERVWNGGSTVAEDEGGDGAGGSGCSAHFVAQPWQQELPNWSSVGCGSMRAVADVSADADPYTGAAVYDSTGTECAEETAGKEVHWCQVGGTSLASPLIAATFALAGGAGGVEYAAKTLYENEVKVPDSLHDVESGSNGECSKALNITTGVAGCTTLEEAASCSGKAICLAGPGYDGPSGVGTPDGIGGFEPGKATKKTQLISFTSTAPSAASVAGPTYSVQATASSGLAVSLSSGTPAVCPLKGSTVSFIAAGTCTILAGQPGSANYQAAPQAQQSFAVGKGAQLISFTSTAPSAASVAGPTYSVQATASSGLAVSLSSGTPAVCPLKGSTVSFIAAGTCTILAGQSGNANYQAAPQAQQSFAVGSGPAANFTTLTTPLISPIATPLRAPVTTSLAPPPNSRFTLLGHPSINHATGAITFTVSVDGRGVFSWLLTFRNGKFGAFPASKTKCEAGQLKLGGRCRPTRIVFAKDSMALATVGTVRFTVRPSASARIALANALKRDDGLPVTALLTFHSSLGGSPVSHAQSITVKLERATKKGKR